MSKIYATAINLSFRRMIKKSNDNKDGYDVVNADARNVDVNAGILTV